MDTDFSMIQPHYGARGIFATCSSFDNSAKTHFDHNGDLVWLKLYLCLLSFIVRGKICDDGESSKRLRESLFRVMLEKNARSEGVMMNWFLKRVEITYLYYTEDGTLNFQVLVDPSQPLSNRSHRRWLRFWLPAHFVIAPLLFDRRGHSQ